ncbi:L-threonine 3-dehydrogenase [Streptomyces glaucescens]
MKALCWEGVNKLSVENVPDPELHNDQDMIVRLIAGTTCGSDLHLIGGYIPAMRAGDIIGHEFLGEVVETGPGVRRHAVGDRVVVCSFVGCGRCWYCANDLWSLCDNTNTNPGIAQAMFGSRRRSSATRTPWAACAAATPNTSACRSPTTGRSPSPRASTTPAPCSARCSVPPPDGWAPTWPA